MLPFLFLDEIEKGSETITIAYRKWFGRDEPAVYTSTFPLPQLEHLLFTDLYTPIMDCDRA